MQENKYSKKIQELEKNKQFDVDVKPVNERFVKEMNPEKFKYRSKNIFWKLYEFLVRSFVYIMGPLVTFSCFRLKVKGKKNLKAIKGKGAIVVCNHVHTMDSLYLMQVSRTRKMYHLAAPFNNKKGLAGLTLRVGGLLPIGKSIKLTKQLDTTITKLLKSKKLITIYAEGSMWLGYTKVRPLKNGAFHYAVKNNSPVVPVVALFRKTNHLDKIAKRKYKITLQILPPVFPKENEKFKANVLYMNNACHKAMVECANNFYGCECDAEKVANQQNTAEIKQNGNPETA